MAIRQACEASFAAGVGELAKWKVLQESLQAPLSCEREQERAISGVLDLLDAGHQPPADVPWAEMVGTIETTSAGRRLTDLAATLLCRLSRTGKSLQRAMHKRRLVDASLQGPKVSRWALHAARSKHKGHNPLVAGACDLSASVGDAPAGSALQLTLQEEEEESCVLEDSVAPRAPPELIIEPQPTPPQRRKKRGRYAWTPGKDVKGFLGRGRYGHHVTRQSQVLITNGYQQLARLSYATRKALCAELHPVSDTSSTTLAAQILSGLLRVPARTVENTVAQALRRGGGRQCVVGKHDCTRKAAVDATRASAVACKTAIPASSSTDATNPAASEDVVASSKPADKTHASTGFINLVRVTQFMSSHGLSKALLPAVANLITLAGGDVGAAGHHRRFCSVAEAAADRLLLSETLTLLNSPLPGTGRLPDLELIVDGGTVGQYYSRGRDQVLVVGVVMSTPWPPYSAPILVACVNEQADGRAEALKSHLAAAFRQLGQPFDTWLSHRFAVAVGDQALAPGGPAAHTQRAGLRLLWGNRPRRDIVDVFHLINTAGKHALDRSHTAGTLCAMLKQLEHSFGLSHGRHLDRCVAAFLNQRHMVCKTPAGHRKMGYMCGVPERFLHKFENFFYGLLVRMRHALEGRGSHSFSWLQGLAEKLCDMTMLTFAFGFVSGLSHHVAGITGRSQDVSDLPWARWRCLKARHQQMCAEASLLGWWRTRLYLLVLLEPYIDKRSNSLRCFWEALCLSPSGHRVCSTTTGLHLGWQLFDLLFSAAYKDCCLITAIPPLPPKTRLVHPTCQCCTRPQLRPGCANEVRGGGQINDTSTVEILVGKNITRLRAPWWVSRSLYCKGSMKESSCTEEPATCRPRLQMFSTDDRGYEHRVCRCPVRSQETLRRLDAGLMALQRFWKDFSHEFGQYCLGDKGVSTEMQDIFEAMSVAWWLPDVVQNRTPDRRHLDAITKAYAHLKADLQSKPWPPAEFGQTPLVHAWPSRLGMQHYYKIWWAQVYDAAHAANGKYASKWMPVCGYHVTPYRVGAIVLQLATWIGSRRRLPQRGPSCHATVSQRHLRRSWPEEQRFLVYHIAGLVHSFMVEDLSTSFLVPKDAIHVKRGLGPGPTGRGIGVLRSPKLRHRLVHIVHCERGWDQREIAASLEQDGAFAAGCYHVNSFFCLSRRFGSTEAPCERWIGAMKYLFHPVQGPTTTTLCQRLRARAAGVRGNGADEVFVRRLADALASPGQRSPPVSKALCTFRDNARKEAEEQAPWLMRLRLSESAAVNAYKVQEKMAVASRETFEPRMLEAGDLDLCSSMKRKAFARLPLFAHNKQQWARDMQLPERDLQTSTRARAWASAAQMNSTKQHAESSTMLRSCSSSSATSSSSSSSGSTSAASSAAAIDSGAVACETEVKALAGVAACAWLAPAGPRAKLHARVDLKAGKSLKLCQPANVVRPGFHSGDTVESAALTGLAWCPRCLNALANDRALACVCMGGMTMTCGLDPAMICPLFSSCHTVKQKLNNARQQQKVV